METMSKAVDTLAVDNSFNGTENYELTRLKPTKLLRRMWLSQYQAEAHPSRGEALSRTNAHSPGPCVLTPDPSGMQAVEAITGQIRGIRKADTRWCDLCGYIVWLQKKGRGSANHMFDWLPGPTLP